MWLTLHALWVQRTGRYQKGAGRWHGRYCRGHSCAAWQFDQDQNLGLLIIDEEQHFGVKHKERLKELKSDIHVLTLSATPIPRTLQLALTGVRELSLITTPPVDRMAVRTFVSLSIRL